MDMYTCRTGEEIISDVESLCLLLSLPAVLLTVQIEIYTAMLLIPFLPLEGLILSFALLLFLARPIDVSLSPFAVLDMTEATGVLEVVVATDQCPGREICVCEEERSCG